MRRAQRILFILEVTYQQPPWLADKNISQAEIEGFFHSEWN